MSTATGFGPQPARLDRPRGAALRVLRALLDTDGRGTVASLHEALGGHANAVRLQLERLVEDGFVTQASRPTSGRGRPAREYAITIAGRQVALEDPHRETDSTLVEAIAEHLAGTDDPVGAAHSIGRRWGNRLAASRGDELLGILAAQGFAPLETPEGIVLQTCPLLASAGRHPEVVCGIHQGQLDALSDEPRRLLPFALPDGCLIRRA